MNSTNSPCSGCRYAKRTDIFDLCTHVLSKYEIAGKADLHTQSHMRLREDKCGESGRLKSK